MYPPGLDTTVKNPTFGEVCKLRPPDGTMLKKHDVCSESGFPPTGIGSGNAGRFFRK
jgi:hypothetical protein